MKTIYKSGDPAGSAYFLESGKVIFSLPECAGFELELATPNVIFGVGELIVARHEKSAIPRALTAVADPSAKFRTIQAEALMAQIKHYNVGFNIAKQIANELLACNLTFRKVSDALSARERRSHEYAKVVANILDELYTVWQGKRFPVLKTIYDEFVGSLTYQYGVSFRKMASKTVLKLDHDQLGSLIRTYPPGAIICKQGEPGDELYILESGELGIYIGDHNQAVVTVTRIGEVTGEMSLLLNEPRTATIKAEVESQISVINQRDLKKVAEAHPAFFFEIGLALAQKMYQTLVVIKEIESKKEADARPEFMIEDPHRDVFNALEKRVALERGGLPVVKEIHDKLRQARIAITS